MLCEPQNSIESIGVAPSPRRAEAADGLSNLMSDVSASEDGKPHPATPRTKGRGQFMIKKEWRQIAEYRGVYSVSNHGEVMRDDSGKILKPEKTKYGYLRACLSSGGRGRNFHIHRLVAAAFIGDGSGLEVNHKDGVKTNNCISNLEYMTHAENSRHAFLNGWYNLSGLRRGSPPGSRSGHAKLNETDVIEIRRSYTPRKHTGCSVPGLARRFGVSIGCVRRVISRKTYAYFD